MLEMPVMGPSLKRVLCVLLLVLSFGSVSISASHISGLRISETGNTGLTVDIDVTAFYRTDSTEIEAYLGTYYDQIPAVDWGDGAIVSRYGYGPSTGIPLVATSTVVNGIPARAFRGSFSHSYATAGTYTIQANSRCCPVTTPTYPLITGTIVQTTVATTGVFGPTTFTTTVVRNSLEVMVGDLDADNDGVLDGDDRCADTVIPEGVPTMRLGVNRFALTDDDGLFDTTPPPGGGGGPRREFTVEDTYGCSCEQIIAAADLGQGHAKFGCSISAIEEWIGIPFSDGFESGNSMMWGVAPSRQAERR